VPLGQSELIIGTEPIVGREFLGYLPAVHVRPSRRTLRVACGRPVVRHLASRPQAWPLDL